MNPWKAAGLVSAIGADLVVCILGGYFAGAFLADKWGHPGWAAAGVIIGLALGIVSVIYMIKRVLEDS
jgi:hypothetical protein